MTAPDPLGLLICPEEGCDDFFAFSQEGAEAYVKHWEGEHDKRVHRVPTRPVITGTAKVIKADGSTYEVPIEGVAI